MPHFSLKRFLICSVLLAAAFGVSQIQYQLIRTQRLNPYFVAAIGMLSSVLFFTGLMALDRHSWKWWLVCAVAGTIFAYFVLMRLLFALHQNQFRPVIH